MEALNVGFGHPERERLEFVFDDTDVSRSQEASEGWLKPRVRISAGAFRGETDVYVEQGDFERLLPELRTLHERLVGVVKFDPIENQIGFTIKGDGKGHIEMSGCVSDGTVESNRIQFFLSFDQTLLAASILDVDRLISAIARSKIR